MQSKCTAVWWKLASLDKYSTYYGCVDVFLMRMHHHNPYHYLRDHDVLGKSAEWAMKLIHRTFSCMSCPWSHEVPIKRYSQQLLRVIYHITLWWWRSTQEFICIKTQLHDLHASISILWKTFIFDRKLPRDWWLIAPSEHSQCNRPFLFSDTCKFTS